MSRLSPHCAFVNQWQKEQFHKYGVSRRIPPISTESLVTDIINAGTRQRLLDLSLEATIRS